MEFIKDQLGKEIRKDYLILTEPDFERRLKAFDPGLKLLFDQTTERWVILQWTGNARSWFKVMTLQDADGTPRRPGDWVFNVLYVYRQRAIQRDREGGSFFDNLMKEANNQALKIREKVSDENRHRIRDDITSWRKIARIMDNRPTSDVTAGYAKVQPKTKGRRHA